MLKNGMYRAEKNEGTMDRYRILINVKETEKSYIFELIEFDSRYGATQMDNFFSKSKRVVMQKSKGGHAMRVWSDHDFTFYPYQAGVPFYFEKVEETPDEKEVVKEPNPEARTYLMIYLKLSNKNGVHLPCPRCGGQMSDVKAENALSRHEECYICSNCGAREALLDMSGQKMNLSDWFAVRFLSGKSPIFEQPIVVGEKRITTMDITYTVDISDRNIDDILDNAFDGGISYWCKQVEVEGEMLGRYANEQISRGGTLKLFDSETDDVYELTKEKFLEGLYQYLSDQPYPYLENGNLDMTNVDSEFADTIVQYALFGEVRYA